MGYEMHKTDELSETVQLLHDILRELDALELGIAAVKVSEAIEILVKSDQQQDLRKDH